MRNATLSVSAESDGGLKLSASRDPFVSPLTRQPYDVIRHIPIDTSREIDQEIARSWDLLPSYPGSVFLRAGPNRNDLSLCLSMSTNVDVAQPNISPELFETLSGSLAALPLPDASVDVILCRGEVISYCGVECERVLRPGGWLLLEYESSRSADLISQRGFGEDVSIGETVLCDRRRRSWFYSHSYIRHAIRSSNLNLKRSVPLQILSPWISLL
jgi:hypothetical protein